MRVQLLYRVPVAVVVDTEERTVERVVVLDEEVRLDAEADVWDEADMAIVDAGLIASAVAIAEGEEWPSWEAGW
jgi:hypothetical protein